MFWTKKQKELFMCYNINFDDINHINDFDDIWENILVSEDFIETFIDYVDWELISIYQDLSEAFIKKYVDYVDWRLISANQKLSEIFMLSTL